MRERVKEIFNIVAQMFAKKSASDFVVCEKGFIQFIVYADLSESAVSITVECTRGESVYHI